VKEGFLSRYLDDEAEKGKKENFVDATNHETPILGDFNTIVRGFSKGGTSASSRKHYVRAIMFFLTSISQRRILRMFFLTRKIS